MLWIKAFHIIFVVCWFAGLFYLPRLFVYHTQTTDEAGNARFKVMEKKLFRYIMNPAAVLTIIFGFWMVALRHTYYSHQMWLHIKLLLVVILAMYHWYCGKIVRNFANDNNKHSEKFFRIFNEVPTVILIAVVILSVVKP